jgi:hypothetical protein
MVPFTENKR